MPVNAPRPNAARPARRVLSCADDCGSAGTQRMELSLARNTSVARGSLCFRRMDDGSSIQPTFRCRASHLPLRFRSPASAVSRGWVSPPAGSPRVPRREGLKRIARGQAPDFRGALLSAPNARRLAARLARLRGAAMKIGQLVSLQGDDVLPPEFAQALSVLRSQAAPMPAQQLHRVLGREYGAGWRRRFARFDDEPIAAASIGQVHRVTAADGRDLALKIQYPGVARSIASDVDNVAVLLRLFERAAGRPRRRRPRGRSQAAAGAGSRLSPGGERSWSAMRASSPTSRRCSSRGCTGT